MALFAGLGIFLVYLAIAALIGSFSGAAVLGKLLSWMGFFESTSSKVPIASDAALTGTNVHDWGVDVSLQPGQDVRKTADLCARCASNL